MFHKCEKLIDISELKYLNTKYCNNFSFRFFGCLSLSNIKGLENWNLSNGNNFQKCFVNVHHYQILKD